MFHSLKPRSFKIILNKFKVGIDGFTAQFFFTEMVIAELPEMTTSFLLGFANQRFC